MLMRRIRRDYRVIIAFNSLLIALGAGGIIQPLAFAMMHNISTLAISMYNMTDLLVDQFGMFRSVQRSVGRNYSSPVLK